MFKIKIQHGYALELAAELEKRFGAKFTVECGVEESFIKSEGLTGYGEKEVANAVYFFQKGINSVNSLLDEIQKHAQLITTKINQL